MKLIKVLLSIKSFESYQKFENSVFCTRNLSDFLGTFMYSFPGSMDKLIYYLFETPILHSEWKVQILKQLSGMFLANLVKNQTNWILAEVWSHISQ